MPIMKRPISTYIVSIVLNVVIFVALIIFSPGLPPDTRFEAYKTTPPAKQEGKLAPNNFLDNAELYVDGEFFGAESIAHRGEEIYTGVVGGRIVRIKNGKVKTIAQIGTECVGSWEIGRRCGRPLGMRFDGNGKLVVADAYFGLFRIDVDSGRIETLVDASVPIEGKRPRTPDDLDIAKDGSIYWSDGSTTTDLTNIFVEYLGYPSGRLLKYDPKTNTSTVLMDGIHFANGVQLSKNEEAVFVCESIRYRVLRYYLKGQKKGQSDILIDGLNGVPDNIRSNRRGGYFISLVVPRDSSNPSVLDALSRLPLIRKLALRAQALVQLFLSGVDKIIPENSYVWRAVHYVGVFGPFKSLLYPKKVYVIEIDENGNILRSLQTQNSELRTVTETSMGEKYTYFGSFTEPKLWRMRNEDLFGEK